ncbi:MAG: class I SAM-dependent methyltransferase [Candidatus Bathyarchaeia archaeon]|jgi:ubiquinone/menaquinone biosynthesis C-methylase UbiE
MYISKQAVMIAKEAYGKLKGKPHILSLKENLLDCGIILDVGCGSGSPIKTFSKSFYSVGVDLFKPAILESKNKGIHDDYILADANNLCFRPNFFDAVLALDVLEHLEKTKGLKLVKTMERVAKKKVVIITPNGFVSQGATADNVFQVHLSGWTVNELKRMGYRVHGIVGLKFLRTEKAKLKYKPEIILSEIADISQKFTYHFPSIAFELLCVKNLQN